MASQGPNSPQTMADDATIGTVAWTNPDNAKASDDVYAVATNAGVVYTHYLKATNFGFSIPTGATINGILVGIERQSDGANAIDYKIQIIKSDGTLGTTNKASGFALPSSDAYRDYGSSSDLWGETWASTDINDVDFGIAYSAQLVATTAHVDHIRITVYYTEAAPATGTNSFINIGDQFKQISQMYINIGDSWKNVANMFINIGDNWHTVF